MAEIRKYFVKQSWIFNLEAMNAILHCIGYDIEDGKIKTPFELLSKTINDVSDIDELREEAFDLEWIAKGGKVTGKEYGRIKEMVEWRVMQRYLSCVNSGMEESKAGICFADM